LDKKRDELMKKKIIFMIINMNVGGTEKALLNMISEMPEDKYNISILMLEKYGDFLASIPNHVQVEYLNEYNKIKSLLNLPPQQAIMECVKKRKFIKGINLMFFYFVSKLFNDRSLLFSYLLRGNSEIQGEYDLAIAYAGPMDFISYFVAHKIKAKKRVQWIHFDVTKIGFNKKFSSKIYKKFDKVFVVSLEGKNKLLRISPKLNNKLDVINNIVTTHNIRKQSEIGSGFNDHYNGIRILTVGRLSPEKGQDMAIRALARLINQGYNVRWYCLGDGKSKNENERLIKELNLTNNFYLLGADPNPYQYMKQCDIYVQPSRYEGYCITLIEAKCFNKPIVTTDVNGAREQIVDGETGLIVKIDEEAIFEGLKKIIENHDLRKKLSDNLSNENYNSSDQLEKLYGLM
jgi:glycosyltransferase involved in cell wall biosynthesis